MNPGNYLMRGVVINRWQGRACNIIGAVNLCLLRIVLNKSAPYDRSDIAWTTGSGTETVVG